MRKGEEWHHCQACDLKWEGAELECFMCGRTVKSQNYDYPKIYGATQMVRPMDDSECRFLGLPTDV